MKYYTTVRVLNDSTLELNGLMPERHEGLLDVLQEKSSIILRSDHNLTKLKPMHPRR